TLLVAAARGFHLEPAFILAGAKAELHARRYDRARALLAGQPWLAEYADGEALAVLAEAEAQLGLAAPAAADYAAARARARGPRAALLAVRAGLAWEAAGEADSAAAAYGAARAGGLAVIEPWLPVRQARVPRDTAAEARLEVERAVRQGDSSAATLLLLGDLLAGAARYRDAERAYRAAAKDAALGSLATYRRARVLGRLGDPGAREALAGFAQAYPGDTAAPTALYVLGDVLADRGDWAGAAQWFGELVARYPVDVRASLARLDTLVLAGLDTAAEAEVRTVLGRAPQQDVDALLAWSDGLAVRGFGPAAVRLGWQAALKAPADPRVLRAIFPWPNRPAVQ